MKKSLLIATAAIVLCPLTAFAQNAQTNVQNSSNSAAAVGTGNYIEQNTNQHSNQTQLDVNGYPTPSSQVSIQDNANSAAAIGNYNAIQQNAAQSSSQTNVDVGSYLPNLGY
jgi:hypothetical protein